MADPHLNGGARASGSSLHFEVKSERRTCAQRDRRPRSRRFARPSACGRTPDDPCADVKSVSIGDNLATGQRDHELRYSDLPNWRNESVNNLATHDSARNRRSLA